MIDGPSVAISALEHYCYCPRQCALIHVDGVWVDNEHTVRGAQGHRRVDEPGAHRQRSTPVVRAITLWSHQYGLVGRADAVEVPAPGRVVPVEYKIGRRHGDAAEVQLCAQALCLEEMLGVPVPVGAVWYSGVRRRLTVEIDQALRERTIAVIEAVHALPMAGRLPAASDDERCGHCQLKDHCLPSLVADSGAVASFVADEVFRCGS